MKPTPIRTRCDSTKTTLCAGAESNIWRQGTAFAAERLSTGKELLVRPEHGRHVLDIITAARKSSATGKRLNPTLIFNWLILAVWVAVCTSTLTPGYSAEKQDFATQYASEIGQINNRQQWREGEMDWLVRDFENLGDLGRRDARSVRVDYERLIATCEQARNAFLRGDEETARRLARETERDQPDRDWRKRYEARYRQAAHWPAESWVVETETVWGGKRAKTYAPQWVGAKRAASVAWAQFADAIAPNSDGQRLVELEDKAHAAESMVRAKEALWRLCATLDERVPDPDVQSPELTEQLQQAERLQGELPKIHQDLMEAERRQRAWTRAVNQVDIHLKQAYQAALEKHNARKAKD